MKMYKYEVWQYNFTHAVDIEVKLNTMGKRGWRLVAVDPGKELFYFERPSGAKTVATDEQKRWEFVAIERITVTS